MPGPSEEGVGRDGRQQQGGNLGFGDVPGRHLADVVRHIMIKKELQQRPVGGGVGLDSPGALPAAQEPVATREE
jgi:hypothetical protein